MKTEVNVKGPSLGIILTIIFVILKLTGVISWSWVWVFAPLWIPLLILLILLVVAMCLGMDINNLDQYK